MNKFEPWVIAIFIGALLTAVGAFVPVLEPLLWPGLPVAALIFPEGIHTGHGVVWGWFIAIWAGALVIWSLLAYSVIKLMRRNRGKSHGV